LSTGPAGSADLSRFPPAARFYPPPPPPPLLRVYNWTGCYLGAQLGGAFADNHVNGNFNTIVPVSPNGDGTGGGIVNLTTPLANNAGSTAVTAGDKAAATFSL